LFEGRIRPLIVPLFIPYQGCPHRCVFCDQESITSQTAQTLQTQDIREILHQAINSKQFDRRRRAEVAFYGGTFTRLPSDKMIELLDVIAPYLQNGLFHSIRVSTRPDAISDDCLEILQSRGVQTVELGVQSLNDRVLDLCRRGHTSKDTLRAVTRLKRVGFRVGIQLMPGLPGDSEEIFRSTIRQVLQLRPSMVRLYPAIVIRGTELCRQYEAGMYAPWSLETAVEICKESCTKLEQAGIPVIRMGLMNSPTLLERGRIVAGPWHNAFGFLVRSAMQQDRIKADLPKTGAFSYIVILARRREIELIRGYKNQGIASIEALTGAKVAGVKPDNSLPPGRIRIERA
jgi:histone acetyltransferase (RNA polymerase elongator complex component)